MSIRQGDKVLAAGTSLTQNLFDHKPADHILNDIQWLRADTFTWHDGSIYEVAYNHLLDDWTNNYTIETDVIAGHTLSYRRAADGHKIIPYEYESVATSIYEDTGIAWYYIIDTTNHRFKLPRELGNDSDRKYLYFFVGNFAQSALENTASILNTRADRNLSNLETQGKNITTWSSNLTDCITEMPQIIRLEVNSANRLVLKAGSKVYIPKGKSNNNNVYQEVDISSDVNQTTTVANKKCLFYYLNGGIYGKDLDLCVSGDTEPAVLADGIWYDAANNRIKWGSNGVWNDGDRSFPLCIAYTGANGVITSLERVFNGFGFIGSHVFSLPGVKCLIPNGRNEDNSLNNLTITTQTSIYQGFNVVFLVNNNGTIQETYNGSWIEQESLDGTSNYNGFWYNTRENKTYKVVNGVPTLTPVCRCFGVKVTSNVVKDINIYYPDRIADYNWVKSYVDNIQTSNCVHKTGDETITGIKTFSSSDTIFTGPVDFTNLAIIKNTSKSLFEDSNASRYLRFYDKNAKNTGWVESLLNHNGSSVESGTSTLRLFSITYTDNTYANSISNVLDLVAKPDGTRYARLSNKTPNTSNNSDNYVATTSWANDATNSGTSINNLVHKTGSESLAGLKTFTNGIDVNDIISMYQPNVTKGTTPDTNRYWQITFDDKNNVTYRNNYTYTRLGIIGNCLQTDNKTQTFISAYKNATNTSNAAVLSAIYDTANNKAYATAPNSDVINSILTTTGISKTEAGYMKLGNGIIIQWGYDITTGGVRTQTLSVPFSISNYTVIVTPTAGGNADLYTPYIDPSNMTTTTFDVRTRGNMNNVGFRWIALGW